MRHLTAAPVTLLFALLPMAANAADPQVILRDYTEGRVEHIAGRPGFQLTVQFGANERIENVAVGDSAAWQVTPNRRADLVFVKPANAAVPATNLTVITDRHTYLFELHVERRGAPVYLVRFGYPDQAKPQSAQPAADVAALADRVATPSLAAAGPSPADLNFAWTGKGARGLMPERMFDDGRAVYLAWPAGRALPVILEAGSDGKGESPLTYWVKGQHIVIEGLHRRLVLCIGKERAVIETTASPSTPVTPGIATAAPAAAPKFGG